MVTLHDILSKLLDISRKHAAMDRPGSITIKTYHHIEDEEEGFKEGDIAFEVHCNNSGSAWSLPRITAKGRSIDEVFQRVEEQMKISIETKRKRLVNELEAKQKEISRHDNQIGTEQIGKQDRNSGSFI